MDRAEAIKRLEDLVKTWDGDPFVQKSVDAFKLAIAALREQEQREQGCEYCDGTDTDLYFHEGACHQLDDLVYISGNRIECDFGCKAWGAFDIKFCPMCGRKLTEPPKEGADHA